MQNMKELEYIPPTAELLRPLLTNSLLVSLSAEGEIDEFELGDEL